MNIKHYSYIEIGRKEGAAIAHSNGINDEVNQRLLIEALPSGVPTDKYFKVTEIDNKLYLSVLHILSDKDSGLALVIELNNGLESKNPVGFVDSMYTNLKETIEQAEKQTSLSLEHTEITPEFTEIKDFDTVIFSLLTQQKTVIVGDNGDLQAMIGTIYECIPSELRTEITFSANSANIPNDNSLVYLVRTSERVLKALDSKSSEYTVLLLPLKTAFGQFSSPKCKHIATLFKEQKAESIKEEIKYLYSIAIESDELVQVGEFAAQQKIEVPDASLILRIRANHFGLKMDKSMLEELGN